MVYSFTIHEILALKERKEKGGEGRRREEKGGEGRRREEKGGQRVTDPFDCGVACRLIGVAQEYHLPSLIVYKRIIKCFVV